MNTRATLVASGLAGRVAAIAPSRLRVCVLALAVVMAAIKAWIAAHTYGAFDVLQWSGFAETVRELGPIGIYGGQPTIMLGGAPAELLYNHPPLSGWMLAVINLLVDLGGNFPLLIRIPAIVADIGSALLVFELLRRSRPAWQAAVAGLLVSLSPILITVSGFHGNTDPVFIMFILLSLYLAIQRRAMWAGVAIGIALSVKLVPLVVLPLLMVYLARAGWKLAVRFAAGGAAVFAVLWVPVLLMHPREFISNVAGYRGVAERHYGIPQFAKWLEIPEPYIDFYIGNGSSLVLLASSVLGAWLVWRRPDSLIVATSLALSVFLLLTPAFGVQYMAWAAAPALLIAIRAGALYNFVTGAFLVQIYTTWNKARPFHWDYAFPGPWRPREFALMTMAWITLAIVIFVGLLLEWRAGTRSQVPAQRDVPVRQPELASGHTAI